MVAEAMPTRERLKHAGDAFQIGGDRRSGRVIRMMDAPIEQLLASARLQDWEYDALARLRLHWTLGQMSGVPRAIDYNRVTHDYSGVGQGERELFHRDQFEIGWHSLSELERSITHPVVLCEVALAVAGLVLGYRSIYRAREAALELLHSGAGNLINAWRI